MDTLDTLRQRRRELETAVVTLHARIDEIDQLLALIEPTIPRRGRPPAPRIVTTDDPEAA